MDKGLACYIDSDLSFRRYFPADQNKLFWYQRDSLNEPKRPS